MVSTKSWEVPNLSELGAYGMPAGAGRKGGKVARKKTRTKPNPTDENRVPLDTTHPSTGSSRQVLSPVEYNIHVSASGMSSVSTHNTFLQLLTGKDTVVLPLELCIHATVIGIHTPT